MSIVDLFEERLKKAKNDDERIMWKRIIETQKEINEKISKNPEKDFSNDLQKKSKKELGRMLSMGYKGDYYKLILREYNNR